MRRRAPALLALAAMLPLCTGGALAGDDKPAGPPPAEPPGMASEAPAAPAPAATRVPPWTAEQAADAAVAAVNAKDEAALKTLAAKDDPDPWQVADELVRRGEFDAADAFAKAAPRVDVERLPAYIASRRGKPDDAARRARVAACNAALLAARPTEALAALGEAETGPIEDVVGVRLATARGLALAAVTRPDDAAAAHLRAGDAAERLGWLARAARGLGESGLTAFHGSAFVAARDAWLRELSVNERRGDRAASARTLVNLGSVYRSLAEYEKALPALERALAAQETLGDRAGAAAALCNIGTVHLSLGDYAKALLTYESALVAQEALGDRAGAATTLGNIGIVHFSLGDYPKALSTFERALAAKEAVGDRSGAAATLGNIGSVFSSLGDYARALSTFERALSEKEALEDKAGAAGTLGNIGSVYRSLGEHAKAIAYLDRSARAAEKLGATHTLVRALRELAAARLESGDAGRAIESAHRAVSLLKSLVRDLGEEQGATARGRFTSLFSTGLAAAAKANDAPEAAFFLESGRAGTMLESLAGRDALRHAALPEALRIAEAQARAAELRALAASMKAQDGNNLAAIRARGEELEAARVKTAEVVERIQREAKREANLWYPVATPMEDIQRFLAPEEALVLYGLAEKDDAAFALVLTRGEARFADLGTSSEIAAACERLDASDRDADPAVALARLRELVVKPLALPKETKRLLVSPEGPLSYVPFAALVSDLEVVYEPSGTTYGVLLAERGKPGTRVLALGDPDYTAKFDPTALDVYAPLATEEASATRGGRLARLAGTREEATAIADVRLFGADATEEGLADALAARKERWRSVHFACHGLVNPDRPTRSSLALTPTAWNDGFLTVLEVLRMKIPSDLVVLSACETGRGKIAGGEGIVGLTRAFMFAGSPRVICSLWKVDDEATKALMVEFYKAWNPKTGSKPLGTAEALRAAQQFVRSHEKWKHPYYWAAWVLWGLAS